MLRSLTSLTTAWTAYRLLRQEHRLAGMDDATAKKWATCIPLWLSKLPTMHLGIHRTWLYNIYRHGDKISQDPDFWKTMQKAVAKFSGGDLEGVMIQAGLFNNPQPFLHFEPYEDQRKNIFGDPQIVTGQVQYMRLTFDHGTHPGLAHKLTADDSNKFDDLALFSLPIREPNALFKTRKANTENYWRFFSGEPDFPIGCLVDYYQSMQTLNPSAQAYASWAHAAWDARRTNHALQKDGHWEKFESQIRPLYEKHIDWELVAACHGFLLSPQNSRNAEIAAYAQANLAIKLNPMARPEEPDAATLGMLTLVEPDCPWKVYTLFADAPEPGAPVESYPLDFN